MSWFKRIFLFMAVNILVMVTVSFTLNLLGVNRYIYSAYGIDYQSLAIFCLVWGMVGAFISLFLSRVMAKMMMGVVLVDPKTRDPELQELLQTVYRLAKAAGLSKMPEVGIYDSPDVNAFATGPSKSRALVAVSTGLMSRMNTSELEGVLGHELTHVANGDMVTLTLIQGIVNAFVMFLSRVLAFFAAQALRGDEREDRGGSRWIQYLFTFVFEIVFSILGSMVVAWFSRYREYRADQGGARLAGHEKMIAALQSLKRVYELPMDAPETPRAFQSLQISSRKTGWMNLFASHPPLDARIEKLRESLLKS